MAAGRLLMQSPIPARDGFGIAGLTKTARMTALLIRCHVFRGPVCIMTSTDGPTKQLSGLPHRALMRGRSSHGEHAAIGAPFTAWINRALQPGLKGWRLAPGVAPWATLVQRVALSPCDASDSVS